MAVLCELYILLRRMIESRVARPVGDDIRSPGWPDNVHIRCPRFVLESRLPPCCPNCREEGTSQGCCAWSMKSYLFTGKAEEDILFLRPQFQLPPQLCNVVIRWQTIANKEAGLLF